MIERRTKITVGELMAELSKFAPDTEVALSVYGHATVGGESHGHPSIRVVSALYDYYTMGTEKDAGSAWGFRQTCGPLQTGRVALLVYGGWPSSGYNIRPAKPLPDAPQGALPK